MASLTGMKNVTWLMENGIALSGIICTVPSGHGPDRGHLKPPTLSYFIIILHFGSKIFFTLVSVLVLVHPKKGLVWYHENQKTQIKNTTVMHVMAHQTATGPKVLKNWYGKSGF